VARRNEKSSYTLKVAVTGEVLKALPGAQDAKVGGTRFHATAQVPCKPPFAVPAASAMTFPTRCSPAAEPTSSAPHRQLVRPAGWRAAAAGTQR
jgi:hypothetical protein